MTDPCEFELPCPVHAAAPIEGAQQPRGSFPSSYVSEEDLPPARPGSLNACKAGAGADDCEYICTEPAGHDGVHKQVRKDGACTILDATWPRDTDSSSVSSDLDRIAAALDGLRFVGGDSKTAYARLDILIDDVRRETIEECAKGIEDGSPWAAMTLRDTLKGGKADT